VHFGCAVCWVAQPASSTITTSHFIVEEYLDHGEKDKEARSAGGPRVQAGQIAKSVRGVHRVGNTLEVRSTAQ